MRKKVYTFTTLMICITGANNFFIVPGTLAVAIVLQLNIWLVKK